jgi:flagellar protein FlbD
MIQVTCLDNSTMTVNVELIQSFRETPDTVITFVSKDKIVVKEPVEEISKRILEYQQLIHRDSFYIHSLSTQSPQRVAA